jgi:Tfp pilus assembly protein PilN
VFFVLDQPKRSKLHDIDAAKAQLQAEINAKTQQLDGFAELNKAYTQASERARSINRLIAAKVVPANLLQELGEILTVGHWPTMTKQMARRTGSGPDSDPNRRYDTAWDPTHVWLTSFTDTNGVFRLEGGAQAEVDITQLSKRMQASAYFDNVAQASEERQTDHDTGVPYYKFAITGKVAY